MNLLPFLVLSHVRLFCDVLQFHFCCDAQLDIIYHVVIGGGCVAVTAGSILIGEKRFVQFAMKRLIGRRAD